MRLIDADALGLSGIEIVMCNGDYKEALKMLIDKIERAPVIEERKKGKWIVIEAPDIYVCPFCKHASSKKNFCATCGADMKGEDIGKNSSDANVL